KRRVVSGGAGKLDLDQHVGALMFDRLERSDRAAELKPRLGVFDRLLEASLCTADLFGGEHRRREREDVLDRGRRIGIARNQRRASTGKSEPSQLPREVERRQRG